MYRHVNITYYYFIVKFIYNFPIDTNPHAVTTAGDMTYTYDISGNIVSRTHSGDTIGFRYSLYGELLGADNNGESTNYLYDHTNRRVVKYNSGILEHHVIDGYEVEYETGSVSTASGTTYYTLSTILTHIMFGDEKIATLQSQSDDRDNIKTDQLIYHHSDHLNSSTFDFSLTGSLLQATDYQPFGKTITYEVTSERVPGNKGGYENKYLFASKQLDKESDLQYFEKRYYDPRIGKFTTEDPVFWEVGFTERPNQYITDPQSWNSYSYTRNNPINLVDPTGECWFGAEGESCIDTYKSDLKDALNSNSLFMNFAGNLGEQNVLPILESGRKASEGNLQGIAETGLNIAAVTPVGRAFKGGSLLMNAALDGGKHSKFVVQLLTKTQKELKNSINSFDKLITKHQNLIKNPEKYLTEYGKPNNWNKMSKQEREGMLNHWQNEINNFQEQKNLVSEVLSSKKK